MSDRATRHGIAIIGHDLHAPTIVQEYRHTFDVVTSIAVFEHLVDFKGGVEIALALLKDDGVLLFEIPLLSGHHDNASWFRSSLEHVYYPCLSSIEYLFQDVLKVHLVGSEVNVRDFASNYVGIVTRRGSDVARLRALFARLTDRSTSPQSPAEARARRLLVLVHAATSSGDLVEGIADLPCTPPMAARIGQLWKTDLERLESLRSEREALQGWRQVAEERKHEIADLREQLFRQRATAAGTETALERARADTTALRATLHTVFTSLSWKATRPVRAFGSFMRSLRGVGDLQPGTVAGPVESPPPVPAVIVCRQEPWPASQPLVSVIILCDNYGHFVADAIDSVLAQTFQDFEIIVIDGGSSPASVAALRALERPKTSVYFREGRHLVGDDRNFGIAQARGKYVCCLDADDMLRPTYLETALFLLETQGYDLVSTSIQCFGDRREIHLVQRFPALADMLQANQVSTCAVFRKDLWARAGGFQDTGVGPDYFYEDWRLWIRFAALGARVANIVEKPLLLHRVHSSESLSNRDQPVPSIDRQREAMLEFNKDVITDDTIRASEDNRRRLVRIEDGLVNLRRAWAAAVDEPTILIAVPFLIVGGADRLLNEVVGHLAGRGFRFVIVTTVDVDAAYGDEARWLEAATTEIYELPRMLARDRWREFIELLFETRRFSLLWLIGDQVFYDLLPEIKAARPRLRVIDSQFNTGAAFTYRKYAEYFDRILVDNREVATWLLQRGERPEKVLQIPSGVNLDAYRPQPKSSDLLDDLGIPEGAFIVGYSGRLSEEKMPAAFVEIADRCRDRARLVFVMTGTGPLADQIRQDIDKRALADRLRFLGLVESVKSYMASYDVLILPSLVDGRPFAVVESLALGVPVVASRVGALPELIEDGVNGFICEAGDIEAFAERVCWLADHPEEHRRMKAAARAFAEAHLDGRRMLERYEEVIRGVLRPGTALAGNS
jgi:glycosyltransferase involved in cell wall biosynthesis